MLPRSVLAAAAVALTVSCAPRPPASAPLPPPPPAPAPPPPAPAPPPLSWQDAPASAGDWAWRDQGGASSAAFGAASPAVLVISCGPGRDISLVRAGASGTSLIVRTSERDRSLPASMQPEGLTARVAASDPLLDDIAFSRGRFAVEAQGAALLIVPAWPEPARVIEDCRG